MTTNGASLKAPRSSHRAHGRRFGSPRSISTTRARPTRVTQPSTFRAKSSSQATCAPSRRSSRAARPAAGARLQRNAAPASAVKPGALSRAPCCSVYLRNPTLARTKTRLARPTPTVAIPEISASISAAQRLPRCCLPCTSDGFCRWEKRHTGFITEICRRKTALGSNRDPPPEGAGNHRSWLGYPKYLAGIHAELRLQRGPGALLSGRHSNGSGTARPLFVWARDDFPSRNERRK